MGHATDGFDERLNVAAVGASAGGVEALMDFAAGLPPDLDCAVVVVPHIPTGGHGVLARILDRSGPLTDDEVESALPLALRSRQEKCKQARRMADNIGSGRVYQKYGAFADEADHAMSVLGARLAEVHGGGGRGAD